MAGPNETLYLAIAEPSNDAYRTAKQKQVLADFQAVIQAAQGQGVFDELYEVFLRDYYADEDVPSNRPASVEQFSEPTVPSNPPIQVVSAPAPILQEYEVEEPIPGDTTQVKLINLFRTFFNELARDPYTGLIMEDPVIAPDGFCYERATLNQYLTDHNSLTPQGVRVPTRPEQKRNYLIPNTKLKRAIKAVVEGREKLPSQDMELSLYSTFITDIGFVTHIKSFTQAIRTRDEYSYSSCKIKHLGAIFFAAAPHKGKPLWQLTRSGSA